MEKAKAKTEKKQKTEKDLQDEIKSIREKTDQRVARLKKQIFRLTEEELKTALFAWRVYFLTCDTEIRQRIMRLLSEKKFLTLEEKNQIRAFFERQMEWEKTEDGKALFAEWGKREKAQAAPSASADGGAGR